MASLKHLLCHEEIDNGTHHLRKHYFEGTTNEIDASIDQADTNWLEVWNETLGFDLCDWNVDGTDVFSNLNSEPLNQVGNTIEAWAETEFPNNTAENTNTADVPGEYVDGGYLCYGKIHETRVKLIGEMKTLLNTLNNELLLRNQAFYQFDIRKDSDAFSLALPNDTRFALFNRRFNTALDSIWGVKGVSFQVLAPAIKFRKFIVRARTSKDAFAYVDVNIYGALSNFDEVGEKLTKEKIWLQRPNWYEHEAHYKNPQVLDLEGKLGMYAPVEVTKTEPAMTIVAGDSEALRSEVYSSLTRTFHTKRTTGDVRYSSKMMLHQEEALNFMLERENGPIQEAFRLWLPASEENDAQYRHAICGLTEYEIPPETGGGILADVMGLGKTFTTLALIVQTLGQALSWYQNRESYIDADIVPSKILSRASLVIVPSPQLINNWRRELKHHIGIDISVLVYHGSDRSTNANHVANHDIVITTYQTLVADNDRGTATLGRIGWFRIVLDEAHYIRRSTSKFFKYVSDLDARSRWCLTGTPIQNHLDDVGSLLSFIRIYPFERLGAFRKYISLPFYDGGPSQHRYQEYLRKLLDAVCLRRTEEVINLQNIQERVQPIQFSKEEQEQYAQANHDINITLQMEPGRASQLKRFGILQAQIYLRLLCNHGTFQRPFAYSSISRLDMRDDAMCSIGFNGDVMCALCKQVIRMIDSDKISRTNQPLCKHSICADCADPTSNICPLCPGEEGILGQFGQMNDKYTNGSQGHYFQPRGFSSKMNTLLKDLQSNDSETKSIVFSCWTTTLDLVERFLSGNITYVRIDGSLATSRREDLLKQFEMNKQISTLIMTIGVGAIGLNVVAANQIYLLEPHWNPSVEAQAIGRAHRIGQKRKVKVVRYVVNNSVEQDIRKRQSCKNKVTGMAQQQGQVSMMS